MKTKKHLSKGLLFSIIGATCLASCATVTAVTLSNLNHNKNDNTVVPANLIKYDDTTIYGLADGVTIEDLFLNGYTILDLSTSHLVKNIKKIAPYAFESIFAGKACSIDTLTLPENLQEIGQAAFYFCPALKGRLYLPSSLKTIGQDAFFYCSQLSSELTIPNGVKSIGAQAFWGIEGISKLTIPSTVEEVGFRAFAHRDPEMESMSEIDLSSYSSIPNWLFKQGTIFQNIGTVNEVKITVSTSEQNIDDWTTVLKNQGIDEKILVVSNDSHPTTKDCFILSDNDTIVKGFVDSLDLSNYDTLEFPLTVTKVDKDAFNGKIKNNKLKFQMTPNIVEFGENAFKDCSGLICNNVTIPSTITKIGKYAFENCYGLTGMLSFETPANNINLDGEGAFKGCVGLTGIQPAPKITFSGPEMFGNCPSIALIDSSKYKGTTLMEQILELWPETTPKQLNGVSPTGMMFCSSNVWEETPDDSTFQMFFNRTTQIDAEDVSRAKKEPSQRDKWQVQLYPTNETDVPEYSGFVLMNKEHCYGLSDEAKSEITNYNTVRIPSTVTSIEASAFKDELQPQKDSDSWNLILNLGIETIKDSAFENCTGIVNKLILPNTVRSIGNKAFNNCSDVVGALDCPNSLESIGQEAFSNTRINRIKFNNSLKTISSSAFVNMPFVQTVDLTCFKTVPTAEQLSIGENAFKFSEVAPSVHTVYVTAGTEEEWRTLLLSKGLPSYWTVLGV